MKLSFRKKLIFSITPAIILGMAILATLSYLEIKSIVSQNLSSQMLAKTEQAGFSINTWLEGISSEVRSMALTQAAKNVNQSFEEMDKLNMARFKYLEKLFPGMYTVIYTTKKDASYHGVGKKNGVLSIRAGNLSKRAYIKEVLKTGKPMFSKPLISTSTGKLSVYSVAPIKQNGDTIGVMGSGISLSRFENLTKYLNLNFGKSGYGMIIDKDGTFIAHPNKNFIMKKKISDLKSQSLNELGKLMVSGKSGIYQYTLAGVKKIAFYTHIPVSDWSLVSVVNYNEFFSSVHKMIRASVIAISIILILIILVIIFVSARLLRPLEDLTVFSNKMSEGNLSHELDNSAGGEFGELANHFNDFMENLRNIILEIINMTSELTCSMTQMAATNENFTQNSQSQAASAEEVTATIEEVSSNMENIAIGANEQNNRITELVKLEDRLDNLVKTMESHVGGTLEMTDEISSNAQLGEQAIYDMTSNMEVVEKSSEEVENIVRIITDISEQINLLSLNAAIEAARAGDMGRGFAVVADEISKLADQTAASIKDIDTLLKKNSDEIKSSMSKVHNAVQILSSIINKVDDIRLAMHDISGLMEQEVKVNASAREEINTISERSEQINNASKDQQESMSEIVKAVSDMSNMTQSNASCCQKMSENAWMLTESANKLKSKIDFFKIK